MLLLQDHLRFEAGHNRHSADLNYGTDPMAPKQA